MILKMKNNMKKIILIFLSFLFLTEKAFAQEAALNQAWVCLSHKRLAAHKVKLLVDKDKLPSNSSPVYIFECFSNNLCTSGNYQKDIEVLGQEKANETHNKLKKIGYKFEGSKIMKKEGDHQVSPSENVNLINPPLQTNASGEIPPVAWQSSTPKSRERRFLAMTYFKSETTGQAGEERTQQIGTFNLDQAFSNEKCVAISWDPYGRVFDANTLEPIKDVKVKLLVKRNDGKFTLLNPYEVLGRLDNPQQTGNDGGFSFVVPDNTYRLDIQSDGYFFPVSLDEIHPNYKKIYSEIYPKETGLDIIQKGAIQHRDIPLKPKGSSQDNPVELINYFYDLNKITNQAIITGRTSHPFTKINIYSLKVDPVLNTTSRYRLISSFYADKMGSFKTIVDQNKFQLEEQEVLGDIVIEKTDLTGGNLDLLSKIKRFLSKIFYEVQGQVRLATTVRLNPILNYIEGYAYDDKGNIIPNAKIDVVLDFSDKPYYQTQADEKGFYQISSTNLPSMPYHLVIKKPTEATGNKITTTNFLASNYSYLKENKIALNNFNKEEKTTLNSTKKKPLFSQTETNKNDKTISPSLTKAVNQEKKVNNNFFVVFLGLIIFVLLFLIVGFYLVFKNQQRQI